MLPNHRLLASCGAFTSSAVARKLILATSTFLERAEEVVRVTGRPGSSPWVGEIQPFLFEQDRMHLFDLDKSANLSLTAIDH
jgi:hypothetical protein